MSKRRFSLGIGAAKSIDLDKARSMAATLNAMSDDEFIAYAEERKKKKLTSKKGEENGSHTLSFKEVAERFAQWNIEVGNWEELGKAHKLFLGRLRLHLLDFIGDIPINELQPSHVAQIATSLWEKPDTVDRCLGIVRQVFDWSKANNYCTQDNPASRAGALKYLLPSQKHIPRNFGALGVKELPHFFAAIYKDFGHTAAGRCLLFSILIASRPWTARSARWDQIDFEKRLCIIPPEQLKVMENGSLIVPLHSKIIYWLTEFKPEEAGGFIYANSAGKILSETAIRILIQRSNKLGHHWIDKDQSLKLGKEVRPTPHGIARATFRTWAQDDELGNDVRFSPRVAELCLHHKARNLYNGAYERNSSFLRRREMMEAWCDYCFSELDKKGTKP